MRVEPVADTIGTSREATSASPTAALPMTICASPAGASPVPRARWAAIAASGVKVSLAAAGTADSVVP